MILYNYQCLDCTHEFEDFAEMNDKSLKSCPKCDTIRATKTLSSKMHFAGLPTPKFHGRD